MKLAIVLLTLTLAYGVALADELVGDRPDFTESAQAVAPGRVQIEAGATLETNDLSDTWSVGEILVRYGLKPGTEFRVVLPSLIDIDFEHGGFEDFSGADNAALGLKQELATGNGSSPQVAVLTHVTLPTGDEDVVAADTAWDLVLAVEWTLTENLGLGVNLGGELVFADDTESQQWASAAFGLGVTDRLGAYVEGYVFTEELDEFTSAMDLGATYLVTADLQLDVRVGFGLGDVNDEVFYGAGVVTRF